MQYKYQTMVVPFLYGPILPQRSHFIVGLWWATGPTLPRYWPNFTTNYGVMTSCWFFSVLFELLIANWNPFQRWFSEVAPVSWHINFISGSYGWGVRARFVIFGCSLPHLTILQIILDQPSEFGKKTNSKKMLSYVKIMTAKHKVWQQKYAIMY